MPVAMRSELERLTALVRFEADRAAQWFDRGMQLAPLLDRRSAACVLAMAGIYRRLLDRIDARPRARRVRRRMSLPAREKAWVAARVHAGGGRVSAGRRVVVVGGGLAGIAAALDCAAAGAEVTLRGGPAAGSAARPTRSSARACEMDNGQHVFLRCCGAYRGLLARLGSEQLVTRPAAPARSRC